MTTRQERSVATSFKASYRPSTRSTVMALSLSGRFNVIRRTPAAGVSTSTLDVVMAGRIRARPRARPAHQQRSPAEESRWPLLREGPLTFAVVLRAEAGL